MKNNIWSQFKIKKELENIVRVCIGKLLKGQPLTKKERELMEKVSK